MTREAGMSLESPSQLHEARAFDRAPRGSELHEVHVPFDVRTGGLDQPHK
jgi:hypothetical protein